MMMIPAAEWLTRDCEPHDGLGKVSEYPHLAYSMHDVRRAGQRLAGVVLWDDGDREEIYRTFAIASSWRDSHVYPMRSVRMSLIQRMRRMGVSGFTASRPKRMASIRQKLKKNPGMQLDKINDLAGCRVVVDDIAGVWKVVKECTENFRHPVHGKIFDYISVGKQDGYRSYHVVFKFDSDAHEEAFGGRRVELQIRTRLQHSWATAVEAVGLYRNENFKAGEGDPDWLRLFKLISMEFALAERCEEGVIGDRRHRLSEIRDLNRRLGAVRMLENLRNMTQYFSEYVQAGDAKYYLISYDHATQHVDVTPYGDALVGSIALDKAERDTDWDEGPHKVVLVEIDKISGLVDAYPNYFGDVRLFTRRLRDLCRVTGPVFGYELRPQELAPVKRAERPDMSWLHHAKSRRWFETGPKGKKR